MSIRRPEIFVSATSSDLRSCRQTVKEGLLTLGCVPVEQTNFPPDHRIVRDMLRTKIAACDAVIHLAGECFGAEPRERDSAAPRRSYTQIEYDLARELGKPLYVFLCGLKFPYDPHPPEEGEKHRLQQAHRAALATSDTLRCEVDTHADLALRVREMQTNVEHLRGELRKTRSWLGRGMAAGLVILAVLGGGLWWLNQRTVKAETRVAELQTEFDRQRSYVMAMSEAFQQQQAELEKLQLPDDEKLNRALATVAKREKLPEPDYWAAVKLFVASVRANPKAAFQDRMLADFADRKLLAAFAAELAAKISPSGTIMLRGNLILLIGNKPFKVGTRFTATYNQQDYELELVAFDRTSFTLRLDGVEITRPIVAKPKASETRVTDVPRPTGTGGGMPVGVPAVVRPAAPATDREILAILAAQITPSGMLIISGKPVLMIANKSFESGTRFTATYNNQDYELELVAISQTTFTLRHRGEEITRPINPIK